MTFRAKQDTYATDNASGVPIRRFVAAGDVVPESWTPEDDADVEELEELEDIESKQEKPKAKHSKSSDDA